MLARIGCFGHLQEQIDEIKSSCDSGRVNTIVTGISTGFGGTEQPVFVPTDFPVKHAVANLALEYDDIDASAIYSYGNDLNALEVKLSYPATGNGFFIEYFQKDPNADSRLVSNWYAQGYCSNT